KAPPFKEGRNRPLLLLLLDIREFYRAVYVVWAGDSPCHTSKRRPQCIVRLVALPGLSCATLAQCAALRAEAGRLWTDLVQVHTQARTRGQWLSAGDLELATKGGQYALHTQSVQALCQKLAATLATATALRQQGLVETGTTIQTAYASRPTPFQ